MEILSRMLQAMVVTLREGVEAVLFLFALSAAIGANPIYNILGGSLGLLLALLFGFLMVKGSLKINLKSFFATTGVVLVLLVFKLVANGLHEFFEAGLLPSTQTVLWIVGFLTKESASVIILMALLIVPSLVMLQEAWGRAPARDLSLTPPEQRKLKAEVRRLRRWTTAAAGVALGISYLLGVSLVVSASASQGIVLAATLIVAVGMALLGSFLPVRQAMRFEPMRALRGI